MKVKFAVLMLVISFANLTLVAQVAPRVLAPAPPMGWNSWDSYGRTITEEQFRSNARWMAAYLKRYGWEYVVIDEGWYVNTPEVEPKTYQFSMSPDGRFIPPSTGSLRRRMTMFQTSC